MGARDPGGCLASVTVLEPRREPVREARFRCVLPCPGSGGGLARHGVDEAREVAGLRVPFREMHGGVDGRMSRGSGDVGFRRGEPERVHGGPGRALPDEAVEERVDPAEMAERHRGEALRARPVRRFERGKRAGLVRELLGEAPLAVEDAGEQPERRLARSRSGPRHPQGPDVRRPTRGMGLSRRVARGPPPVIS